MNIGELIKSVAETQGISASELAKLVHCNRQNIYKIYEKTTLDTSLLGRISKALNFDFFAEISKNTELSGVDNPEAFKEINNRMAVAQFVEVMPRVLQRLGKNPVICFGGTPDIPIEIPLPDYCLAGYDIEFSLDSLLSDKKNCNFGNAIDIKRIECKEIGIDIDLWQFRFSPTMTINIKLDYKTEEEWEKVMKYIFDRYGKGITISNFNK